MKMISLMILHFVLLFPMPHGPLAQTVFPTGTTIYTEGLAYDGVTFYPSTDQRAKLIDMHGTLIHEWEAPDPLPGLFNPLYEPLPESPGHILAIEGNRVRELDWNSNVVWQFEAPVNLGVGDLDHSVEFHHDVVRRANGNTIILCSVLIEVPSISPKPLRDDCIIEVTPAGQIVWKWFTFQHFAEFEFTVEARRLIAEARNNGDWAHANAVSEMPMNHHTHPLFTPGNLIVSYRELNTFIAIDKATGAIVGKVGPNNTLTIGQHQPEMIPPGLPGAGNILVFDNGGEAGYPTQFRGFSRVVEFDPSIFDPLSPMLALNYDATHSGRLTFNFFSPFISGAQRLPNGNTMAVEGLKGRIFEFTPTGDLVWEYMTPFVGVFETPPDVRVEVPGIYRAYRLPFSWMSDAEARTR